MAKIMDRFKVDIKATPDKDYFASIYTIKKKYLIKPGDRIYKVYYDGRGRTWYDTEVIEATDDYIIINDGEIQIKLLYSIGELVPDEIQKNYIRWELGGGRE